MNLEEYKKFLEENAYAEEFEAIKVVKEVLDYHYLFNEAKYSKPELYPRFILNTDKEKLEYDLLIILRHDNKRFERKIGIEFKDTDIKKVISQAVARKKYVDYQYIATMNVWLNYTDIVVLSYFGIGWVIYMKDFAKMIFPARFNNVGYAESIVDFIINQKLKKEADKLKKEIDTKVKETIEKLDRWLK